MTDLTEQWKKGELKEGFYYVSDGAEVTIDYYLCDYWERHFDSDVQQVLAPVPDYKESQKLLSDQLAKNEGVEINAELEAENAQLKTEYEKECHRADELEDSYWKAEKENAKLKELLKECKDKLKYCTRETYELETKIDEVLNDCQNKIWK